jgi:hypothetical protein
LMSARVSRRERITSMRGVAGAARRNLTGGAGNNGLVGNRDKKAYVNGDNLRIGETSSLPHSADAG